MKTVPLHTLASEVRVTVEPAAMAEIVDHFSIPALDSGGPQTTRSDAIDSQKLLLRGGEVLVSRLNPRKPRIHIVPTKLPRQSVASTEFVPLRPRNSDARFIRYSLLAENSRQHLDSRVRSATRSHQRVDPAEVLGLPISDISASAQRRIADFLDDQVARIDSIIEARRREIELVAAVAGSQLEAAVRAHKSILRPLSALTDPERPIQYGIVLPGSDYEGGVPIVKGGDIGSGRLERLELNRTDPAIEERYVRSRIRPGDYVVAIRGSVGEVAEVPRGLSLANLTQDAARVAPHGCHPAWLLAVLASPGVRSEITRRMTGSSVKGINIEDLRRVPIPVPDASAQRVVAVQASRIYDRVRSGCSLLEDSAACFAAYRTSLITAAVTGELDVTTAGSSIPA